MTRQSPASDEELLDLIEASLFQVPLAPDEILAAEAAAGIDLKRLVARVKVSVEEVRDRVRRAAFAETERRLAEQRQHVAAKLTGRPWLSKAEARARILALKTQLGSSASIEGYKLEKLLEDENDLNAIVAELELLLEKSQK
jgi:hypothetical protein